MKKWKVAIIFVLSIFLLMVLIAPIRLPRTVQFDTSLPYTDINGYKYHMEVFGSFKSPTVIMVHGGPGQGYSYMTGLKDLSKNYQVVFYDQRGAGLSPRVAKNTITIQQNIEDLDSIVDHFANGKQVKLIGHSWGGALVIGYLSKHPEKVSQAVVIEPAFLYPGAPVKE